MGQTKDLTGQRFGRLVAIRLTGETKNESMIWECLCDCGNIIYARRNNLVQGMKKSCGCLLRETILDGQVLLQSINDKKRQALIGKKYGKLTVLETFKKNRYYVCKCVCECGKYCVVRSGLLTSGKTISCGCARDFALRENDDLCVDETKLSTLYKSKSRSNKSGIKGVYFASRENKWCAEIMLRGKKKHIGYFDRLDDAAKARKAAEEQYFEPVLNKYGITLY